VSVALIGRITSRVEHLGVWGYDRTRYVPLCGQERNHGQWSIAEAQTWTTEGRRKPLCSRCRQALEVLQDLAGRKS
jgi:hypothetical protein